MAIRRHKYPSAYKCLLHFDYDYPESVAAAATSVGCGGLRDETGLNAWGINGTCRMVGQEAPAVAMDGTPKFGWRCVHFAGTNDYIHALNGLSGVWNLKAKGRYEIDFFMRPTSAVAGGVISLRSASGDALKLTMDSGSRLVLNCPEWGITNATSAHALTQNVFNFVTLRVAGGHAVVYADGREFLSADIGTDANLAVSEVRLGGYVGQMDEFRFVHSAGSGVPQIPSVPHGGALDIHTIGGFGNGSYGDANMMQAGHVRINTYAPVTSISGSSLSIGAVQKGIYGDLSSGDEVMIHLSGKKGSAENELGFYAVRRIQSVFAGVVSLDRPIAGEFTAAEAAANYHVQIVSVPNFKTLSVSANTTIVPLLWDGSCGGLVAFKTQGQCTIDGKIITESAGPRRTDSHNLAHTDMAERFILTGNVFIACGGTFSTSDDSRIGAAYPGDAKGSVGFGTDGAAPSNSPGPSQKGLGGAPGRGGGGGKMALAVPGMYGVAGCSGGGGGGGGRGKGGNGQNCQYDPSDHSGLNPPPGGYGGTVGSGDGETGSSAPNVFIAAKRLRVSTASISTGGAGGGGGGAHSNSSIDPGGGGGAGGANEGVAPVVVGKGGKIPSGGSSYDGEAGTAASGGTGGKARLYTGSGNALNPGGSGGTCGGAGYGGSGGSAGSVFPNSPGQGYTSSISGAGGGGAGTGFCYLSYEELI